jgi:hypothetical protein
MGLGCKKSNKILDHRFLRGKNGVSIFCLKHDRMPAVDRNTTAMFLNTRADQFYEIESEIKKKITKNYDKRNRSKMNL